MIDTSRVTLGKCCITWKIYEVNHKLVEYRRQDNFLFYHLETWTMLILETRRPASQHQTTASASAQVVTVYKL